MIVRVFPLKGVPINICWKPSSENYRGKYVGVFIPLIPESFLVNGDGYPYC